MSLKFLLVSLRWRKAHHDVAVSGRYRCSNLVVHIGSSSRNRSVANSSINYKILKHFFSGKLSDLILRDSKECSLPRDLISCSIAARPGGNVAIRVDHNHSNCVMILRSKWRLIIVVNFRPKVFTFPGIFFIGTALCGRVGVYVVPKVWLTFCVYPVFVHLFGLGGAQILFVKIHFESELRGFNRVEFINCRFFFKRKNKYEPFSPTNNVCVV